MTESTPLRLAVIGAGPVGLALALHAAEALFDAEIALFDARPADKDVSADPRTLALSLGTVQLLERLGAWRRENAQPILEVHVSQQPPSLPAARPGRRGEPALTIRAVDEAVPMLGAVLSYGAVVAPLQEAWLAASAREPKRLTSRFGAPVAALKNAGDGVEVDAGIVERFDLAVIAEGGVFASAARDALVAGQRPALRHDYRQTAWVGQATFASSDGRHTAYERFTRHGPAALLPLPDGRAGLVWCVGRDDDPVQGLDDAQRVAVLNTIFHPSTPRIASISPLKNFPLGLVAERTLTDGRTVRIGNAAQTLHPVAGQGLNLGMRDAFELVRRLERDRDVAAVLRRLEWQRAPDRWAMIAATDFLARSFTWTVPGAGAARGLGLAAVQALRPLKSLIARQMMFGSR
ncbi:MAG TPA: FAD-dependent monooxygenase [Caldimonas sp.]|jgi:2-octaprenyl-6-methoxyphenol hydroxylase|nr:FAD-dependent monooxygenase [Caldimonas sp.]HEX2539632.1 FAD-dependent monooxygenase [Caldimonas sp.]